MKYLLHNLKRDAIKYPLQNKNNAGSHDFIYGEILNRFVGNPQDVKKYKEYFNSLRKFRQKADYTLETFSPEECFKCYNMAQGLINVLLKTFKDKIA